MTLLCACFALSSQTLTTRNGDADLLLLAIELCLAFHTSNNQVLGTGGEYVVTAIA